MGNFSNSFRKVIETKLSDGKDVIAGSSASAVLCAVNRYRSHLTTNSGQMDSFLGALSMDSELISDAFLDEASIKYDDDHPTFTEISSDIATDLVGGLSDCCHNGANSLAEEGVTITDSKGLSYNVIDFRSKNTYIDGNQIIFSQTAYPSKLSESLIYRDSSNHYHLNNFMRTANFVKNQGRRVEPTTVDEYLNSLLLIRDGIDYATETIFAKAKLLANYDNDDKGILELILLWLRTEIGYDDFDNMIDALSYGWIEYDEHLHPLPTAKGCINSLWSIIKDNYESSQLNSFILRTSNAILGGVNTATEIMALVTESISSKFNSIAKFGKGIASAYNRGGIYGVACYIISYVKELTLAQESNGTLKFTDNSRFAPQIYIAGIISTVVTIASQLLGIIVSIFSKIAGVALMIIGSVASSVFKAITYDHDGTYAALDTDDDVLIPIAPYGVYQHNIPLTRITNEDIISLANQGETLYYAEIPGGFIIIGPGSFGPDGTIDSINVEMHPSIADSGNVCDRLIDHLFELEFINVTFDTHDMSAHFDLEYLGPNARDVLLRWISNRWTNGISNSTLENTTANVLSAQDDAIMRERVIANLFIMSIYLGYLCGYQTINDHNQLYTVHGATEEYVSYKYGASISDCGIWYALVHHGSTRRITIDNNIIVLNDPDHQQAFMEWIDISNQVISVLDNNTDVDAEELINEAWYYDELVSFASDMKYALLTPKYDRRSFWAVLITTMVVTALAVAAIAITTVQVKRAIRAKRAANEARIAQAYDAFSKDPSQANYEVYRKAVKKNNLWANVIGGSKFDAESYWHGPKNTDDGSSSGDVSNPFAVIPSYVDGLSNSGDSITGMDAQMRSQKQISETGRIISLIMGPTTS